jgi:hypothetical protein
VATTTTTQQAADLLQVDGAHGVGHGGKALDAFKAQNKNKTAANNSNNCYNKIKITLTATTRRLARFSSLVSGLTTITTITTITTTTLTTTTFQLKVEGGEFLRKVVIQQPRVWPLVVVVVVVIVVVAVVVVPAVAVVVAG